MLCRVQKRDFTRDRLIVRSFDAVPFSKCSCDSVTPTHYECPRSVSDHNATDVHFDRIVQSKRERDMLRAVMRD